MDFIKILANISCSSDRSINIQIYQNNENINSNKNDVNLYFLFNLFIKKNFSYLIFS